MNQCPIDTPSNKSSPVLMNSVSDFLMLWPMIRAPSRDSIPSRTIHLCKSCAKMLSYFPAKKSLYSKRLGNHQGQSKIKLDMRLSTEGLQPFSSKNRTSVRLLFDSVASSNPEIGVIGSG